MKKFFACAAAFCLFVSSNITITAAASAQANVRGWGSITCGNYLTSFAEGDENTQLIQIVSLYTWIEGYLSGKNFDLPPEQQRDVSGVQFEPTMEFFRNICSQFPDVFIVFVADGLYDQLPLITIPADV